MCRGKVLGVQAVCRGKVYRCTGSVHRGRYLGVQTVCRRKVLRFTDSVQEEGAQVYRQCAGGRCSGVQVCRQCSGGRCSGLQAVYRGRCSGVQAVCRGKVLRCTGSVQGEGAHVYKQCSGIAFII